MATMITILSLYFGVGLGLLLGFGIPSIFLTQTRQATLCNVLAHLSGGLLLFGLLYGQTLPFKKVFEDFGVHLMAGTIVVLKISQLTVNYPHLWLLMIIAVACWDVLGFAHWHQNPATRSLARLYSIGLTLLLGLSLVLILLVLAIPTIRLANDLA